MYRYVFFDWFGVVCNKAFWEWAKKNAPDQKTFERMLDLAGSVDKGEISLSIFQEKVGKIVGRKAEQVQQGIVRHVQINKDVIAIIKSLRQRGFRIAVLSNVNFDFLRNEIERESLTPLFEHVLASSTIRLLKPDPKIYRWAIEQTGWTNPILVDDTEENIVAWTKLGYHGILFRNVKQLACNFDRF